MKGIRVGRGIDNVSLVGETVLVCNVTCTVFMMLVYETLLLSPIDNAVVDSFDRPSCTKCEILVSTECLTS